MFYFFSRQWFRANKSYYSWQWAPFTVAAYPSAIVWSIRSVFSWWSSHARALWLVSQLTFPTRPAHSCQSHWCIRNHICLDIRNSRSVWCSEGIRLCFCVEKTTALRFRWSRSLLFGEVVRFNPGTRLIYTWGFRSLFLGLHFPPAIFEPHCFSVLLWR
jgi:hypothetical protein